MWNICCDAFNYVKKKKHGFITDLIALIFHFSGVITYKYFTVNYYGNYGLLNIQFSATHPFYDFRIAMVKETACFRVESFNSFHIFNA